MKTIRNAALMAVMMILVCAGTAQAQLRIAVLDLKAEEIPAQTAKTVSNMLRTELINIGKFVVVERNQMDMIMKEQGMQQTGCTDQDCAVQVGKLLSASKILVGEVSPMGKSIIITVRIVDVEKGAAEFAGTEKADSEEMLDKAVYNITLKLAERIEKGTVATEKVVKKKEEPSVPTAYSPLAYYMWGIVPGCGQIYSGHWIRGSIYLGLFAGSMAFMAITVNKYNDAKDKYDSLGSGVDKDGFDAKYKDMKDASNQAGIGVGITLFVYAFHWVDMIFFSKPDFSAQAGMGTAPRFYAVNMEYASVAGPMYERRLVVSAGVRF